MKIGILGGTFNPIHIGHLILAEEVREKLKLDKVVFVPTFLPPHKECRDVVSAMHRLRMVRLAIKKNRNFRVSDIEIKRKGPSYTIDTLRQLKSSYPKDKLYFITGSDLLNYLNEWKDLTQIITMVKFVVATRPGYSLERIPVYISTISIRAVDVSAFEIRQAVREKRSFRYLVADEVYEYIKAHRLYR